MCLCIQPNRGETTFRFRHCGEIYLPNLAGIGSMLSVRCGETYLPHAAESYLQSAHGHIQLSDNGSDDLNAGVLSQPLGERLSCSLGKQIKGTMRL